MENAAVVVTAIGGLGLLFIVFQIIQDMSRTFIRYNYTSPFSDHEIGNLVILSITVVVTMVGVVLWLKPIRKEVNMSKLWTDITKSIKAGVDTVVEKTEELTQVGKIKVDILNINRKIEKQFAHFDGKVYDLILEENNTNIAKYPVVQEMVNKINNFQKELEGKNQELEQLKVKEPASKESAVQPDSAP